MASNPYQPQDLQSILNTLATYSQPEASQNHEQVHDLSYQANQSGAGTPHDASLVAPQTLHNPYIYSRLANSDSNEEKPQHVDQPSLTSHASEPHNQDKRPTHIPRHSLTDPATIIDWPTGLRYVTKLAAHNEHLASSIQRMIKNQNNHEQQWWAGREAVIERQKQAKDDTKKIDEVLKSIGGQISKSANTQHDNAAELKRYDMKVYKASKAMYEDMDRELIRLGIPFFGVKDALIVDEKKLGQGPQGTPKTPGEITPKQLIRLRKKMLQHLEDLYNEG